LHAAHKQNAALLVLVLVLQWLLVLLRHPHTTHCCFSSASVHTCTGTTPAPAGPQAPPATPAPAPAPLGIT